MERIIIEKKQDVNVEARELEKDFKDFLHLKDLEGVRVLNIYEIHSEDAEKIGKIREDLLYEESMDLLHREIPSLEDDEKAFRIKTHQFNIREEATNTIISKYMGFADVRVSHSKLIILKAAEN